LVSSLFTWHFTASTFMQVVDKAWRDNITSGRSCYSYVLGTGNRSIAGWLSDYCGQHDADVLLWEEFVLFAGIMLAVYGAIAFAAYLLCLLGIRGSAGGCALSRQVSADCVDSYLDNRPAEITNLLVLCFCPYRYNTLFQTAPD